MRRLLFLLPVLLLFSCKQKKVSGADDYYASLNLPYTNVKVQQQQFIDTVTSALQQIAQDSHAVVNTAALRSYLYSLEEACQVVQSIFINTREIDTAIRYKSKVLEYVAFSNMACKGEFDRALNIMDAKTGNRYDSIMVFWKPAIEDLQLKSDACAKAGNDFRAKHNVGNPAKQ